MSDDDIEEFSISDRDLKSAYDPTRRQRRPNKEEALYGIWATGTERAAKRPAAPTYGRGPQTISFVSGGLKDGSKPKSTNKPAGSKTKPILIESYDSDEDSDASADSNKEDDDDDDVEVIGKKYKKRKLADSSDGDDSDIEEVQEDTEKPRGSSDEEIEEPVAQQRPPNSQFRRGAQATANAAPVRDKDFGTFEKHTKGIGMKLLRKMGYKEGQGLGKNLQGRALPIQVVKREGKGAVGRYGNEDPNRVVPVKESEKGKPAKKGAESNAPQWKRQPREKVVKQRYIYKTLDDVLKEQTSKFQNKKSTAAPAGRPKEKIIDMTGREQRILQNYDSLNTKQHYGSNDAEPVFSLKELTHNLDLVIESCEESMIRAHRRQKFDEDTTVALQYDLTSTQQVISEEEKSINRLNFLLNLIDRFEQCANPVENIADSLTLQNYFEELKRNYPKEYHKYHLWDLAVPALHGHLRQCLIAHWDILHGSEHHDRDLIEVFARWQLVLEDDSIDLTNDSSIPLKETMDPYHRLVWDVWMPFLRKAILEWNSRQPERLIDTIDRWMCVLPKWISDNILDHLIFPVLHREVESWNPLTDSVPIHSWLHPWLPLMHDRLEPLYQSIRTKLAKALESWQPSDSSAKSVLSPWRRVFKQGTWDGFMNKYIVPKLVTTMQQFVIDPRQQVLDPWHWFIAWHGLVPLSSMIAILEKTFFPKWLQVLNAWLNTNPNYQEMHRWYSGWRSLLPQDVIDDKAIEAKLREALMMINQRISGPTSNAPPPMPSQPAPNVNFEAIYNRGIATSSSTVVSSFKDLVEKKAADNNMLFLPVLNRTFEGKQVYRFGNANIYIDKNVLFLFDNGQWMPIRLSDLVSRAM